MIKQLESLISFSLDQINKSQQIFLDEVEEESNLIKKQKAVIDKIKTEFESAIANQPYVVSKIPIHGIDFAREALMKFNIESNKILQ